MNTVHRDDLLWLKPDGRTQHKPPLSWRLTLCPFPPSLLESLAGDPHWAGSCGLATQARSKPTFSCVCHPLSAGGHVFGATIAVEKVKWLKTSFSNDCEWPSWLLCHLWTFCTQVWSVYTNSGALKRSKVVTPILPFEFKDSIHYAVVCFLSVNSWVISQHWPPHRG